MGKKKQIQAPPKRDYAAEMRQALNAQAGMMSTWMALERQWQPQAQELKNQMLSSQIKGLGSLLDDARGISEKNALADYNFLSGQMPGVAKQSMSTYEAGLGNSAKILKQAEAQALEELSLGRSLSDEEKRAAQQAARFAMGARGLQGGNQAIMTEVLENNAVANDRQATRRAFAQNVYGLRANSVNNAQQLYGQNLMTSLRSVTPTSILSNATTLQGMKMSNMLQPESKMLSDIISANQGNEMQVKMFNLQQKRNVAGPMGAIGSIIGAAYGGPAGAAAGGQIGAGVGSMFE